MKIIADASSAVVPGSSSAVDQLLLYNQQHFGFCWLGFSKEFKGVPCSAYIAFQGQGDA